jgi:ubiquitin carboxyl-terminal hydrolase L3
MADAVVAAATEASKKQFWLPLESNPEVLNGFAAKLGAEPTQIFHDVYGLDPELLAMVPQPCVAVLLLFPSDQMRGAKAAQLARLEAEKYTGEDAKGIFFLRQYVGNACGTIATVHALANNDYLVPAGSEFRSFLDRNKALSAEERGAALASAAFVSAATKESAQGGQTATPQVGEDINHHFVAFVAHNNRVFELDGTKPFPIDHGPLVGEGDLLASAAVVIKREFIDHVPDGQFNMMALAPA